MLIGYERGGDAVIRKDNKKNLQHANVFAWVMRGQKILTLALLARMESKIFLLTIKCPVC